MTPHRPRARAGALDPPGRRVVPALGVTLALLFSGTTDAAAAPPHGSVAGTIVRVDAGELFIDLGQDGGLQTGDTIEVFRRIEITHPVTHRVLVDRFPIGSTTITESGRLLSIVDDFANLAPRPQVGDFVVLAHSRGGKDAGHQTQPGAGVVCAPTTAGAASDSGPAHELDPFERTFEATLGRPLAERITLWETWLREHPTSARATIAAAELTSLRALVAAGMKPVEVKPTVPYVLPLTARVVVPADATTDQPIDIYVAILEREEVTATRLLVRHASDKTYTPIALAPDGRLGMRASLSGAWHTPGTVNVRVEAVRTGGTVDVLTASDQVITIRAPIRDTVNERGRSRASTRVDWISFWLDDDTDQFLRVEADFRYRIAEGYLEAFRMGLGLFKGRGGPTDALERGTSHGEMRSVDYGFAELEFAFHRLFGLSGRLLVGSFQPSDQREPLSSVFGAAIEARVGELGKTRLYGGAQSTQHLGNEFWLRVAIAEVSGWPMEASVVVTDLPVGADYGVSLGYGLTWQASDLFAIALRVGWNARTINHSGFTVGTGVVLSW